MRKYIYEEPRMDIVVLEAEDVITTSGGGFPGEDQEFGDGDGGEMIAM